MKNDPAIVRKTLNLLRHYGWEKGIELLKQEYLNADSQSALEIDFIVGWIAAERGQYAEANTHFSMSLRTTRLAGWATFGLAFVAMRQKSYDEALSLLKESRRRANPGDKVLRGVQSQLSASIYFHQGHSDLALHELRLSLAAFGRKHFVTGRVIDTLGRIYGGKDNLHAAEQLFRRGIELKSEVDDQAGRCGTY